MATRLTGVEQGRELQTERGALGWWWLAVLIAAVLPSAGTLAAALISDDGAILGYVHGNGGWADWSHSQYQLHSVRFWRPLVTGSFALQEWLTGVSSLPLRLFNLTGHAASAILAGLLARRLGAGRGGALVAGLLVAWYPEQGGNVTWIAGRVDSQCVPFILLACLLALDDRPRRALVAGFVALATKELAVVIPIWVALLAWGRGERPLAALRRALPLACLTLVVGGWRRLALGTWIGGYPSQGLGGDAVATIGACASSLWEAFAPELGFLVLVLLLARPAEAGRRSLALLGCALAAALPLIHLLSAGSLAPEHARTLWLADGALMLALGCAVQTRGSRRLLSRLALIAVMVLAATRGELARENVLQWAEGARLAETQVQTVRDLIAGDSPTEAPALSPNFSRLTESGAYVLHWGVADRFRAPFARSPRPVWPWRSLLGSGGASGLRELCFELDRGVARPVEQHRRRFPELELRSDGDALQKTLVVTSELVLQTGQRDPSPRLSAVAPEGVTPTAWELVFVCELGYRAVPIGGATQSIDFTLRDALLAVADAFLVALDFRAQRGYLELRAIDAGPTGRVLASSRWIELSWTRDELSALFE